MVQETVSHSGRVIAADPKLITVEIVSESACAACHAKGLCSLGEQKVKQVEVPAPASPAFSVGEEVWVDLKASEAHKAVWIAYVGPLIILVAVVMSLLHEGYAEWVAGLAGIGGLAGYFVGVWWVQKHVFNKPVFSIRKKQ